MMRAEELISNREIKFRAWNKQEGEMYEDVQNNMFDQILASMIVMQYTGLKDKNGKEVYEGDVVKCLGGRELRPVVFVNGCFHLERTQNNKLLTDKYIPAFGYCTPRLIPLEVMGNIFENPELLTPDLK